MVTVDQRRLVTDLRRGMSRREMIARLIAAGASATGAAVLAGGAAGVLAATPKKGGRLRFATDLHGPKDSLDPLRFISSIDYTRGRAHYNNLVQLDEWLVPRPELAEEFSFKKNATEWSFKLRKDVRFHDGSKLTADDVIWSLNRHLGKQSKSLAYPLVAMVREFRKIDPYTIRAYLETPNSDLINVLGTFHFKILKRGTTNFRNPPGTGPYRLKEFKPGERSVHVRNDDYWRAGAHLDEIELFAITDPVVRVNALLSRHIHMLGNLDPKAIGHINENPGVGLWSVPSGAYMGIVCMTNTAPGVSPDFVLAMKYLQHRERIVKSILKSNGTIGNDQPISPAYPDYCASLPQRSFDPDKAAYHLKRSGIHRAEVQVAEVAPGITDVMELLKREAARIGFELILTKVPVAGYWTEVWMKTPMHVVSWNMRPTANVMMTLAFAPDAPWNDSRWKNERFAKLLVESRGYMAPDIRAEMYCEMEKLIRDESGVVIPAHHNYVDAKLDTVQGISRQPLGQCGGCEWPEFAWLTDA